MGFAADTFIFIGIGFGIFFISVFILNFTMKGFIRAYLRVKASRGKLTLIEAVTPTDNYWTVGETKDKALCYKTRHGEKKRITPVPKRAIEHTMGIFKVKVDEHDDFFYMPDGKLPSPGEMPDAIATDNMIQRIIMAAGLNDPRTLWILILCGVTLLATFVIIFMTNEAITAAKACQTLTATIR